MNVLDKLQLIREARRLLSKEWLRQDIAAATDLAKQLKNESYFAYAAELYLKLLSHTNSKEERDKLLQPLVICIYKDPDLPSNTKFDLAIKYLREIEDPDHTENTEILGKMGAIYKYKWQYDNQFRNLLYSRHYYKKGYDFWLNHQFAKADDNGYNAINYAFILDQMSAVYLDELSSLKDAGSTSVARWQQEASAVRESIKTYMEKWEQQQAKTASTSASWIYATGAECYFGLGDYKQAEAWYTHYAAATLKQWELYSTSRQLMALAELKVQTAMLEFAQEFPEDGTLKTEATPVLYARIAGIETAARRCLSVLNKNSDLAEADIALRGKFGLALSGGGFRAALYHIGMLARMAELNLLRHVEVLSCVSGGSIVGTYYFLLLKKKMEAKTDAELNRQDYIDIVQTMQDKFLRAVQSNLRVQVLSSFRKNLKMMFSEEYTRTHRLGELYESELYQEICNDFGWEKSPRLLIHHLRIQPKGQAHFNIKTDNWCRNNKVPMMVLNATALNTGHNWQFTASWMGEPPGNIMQEIDSKPRLRRMYYEDAPAPYTNNIPIGAAVGASSCVPALFEPLLVPGLYEGLDLMLVDGGVHDNQGVSSLLEQECRIIFVSDASGQLPKEDAPKGGVLNAFFRSDAVLQERIRENQYLDLSKRADSAQLNALYFVHLKKGLQENPIKWKNCGDPTRKVWLVDGDPENETLTSYSIRKKIQLHLAALRTDLDAFSDVEAYALMYDAYRQTGEELLHRDFTTLFDIPEAEPMEVLQERWSFFSIRDYMEDPAKSERLIQRLAIGKEVFFKYFKASRALRVGIVVFSTLLMGMLVWSIWPYRAHPFVVQFTFITLAIAIGIYLVDVFVSSAVAKMLNFRSVIIRSVLLVALAGFLALAHKAYLLIFNQRYLRFGSLEALAKEDKPNPVLRFIKGLLN
ncbi:MAG: patatin-like phospholipase family protein [Lewinellaceae bacterium]|nr:patatin-like phospholipase family protein [Lewinellaceae bacterium]